MGGTKSYGIITQSKLNKMEYGGATYTQTTHLTEEAVDVALNRAVNSQNLKVSNAEAARLAVENLKAAGFKNVRTVRTVVTDGSVSYKVISNNRGQYGAVESKDRKKKKK